MAVIRDGLKYLIWSNQHGMWWGPDRNGYTPVIEAAGRYELAEAAQIVNKSTVDGRLVKPRLVFVLGFEERLIDTLDESVVLAPECLQPVAHVNGLSLPMIEENESERSQHLGHVQQG